MSHPTVGLPSLLTPREYVVLGLGCAALVLGFEERADVGQGEVNHLA